MPKPKPIREPGVDVATEMAAIGKAARTGRRLANATTKEKNAALRAMAKAIWQNSAAILAENALDVADAREAGSAGSFIDRLALDPERVEAMAAGIDEIAALPDPVGTVPAGMGLTERPLHPAGAHAAWRRRHHLRKPAERHRRRRGALPEGRQRRDPEGWLRPVPLLPRHPRLPVEGLEAAGLPKEAIQIVPTRDRTAVGHMLAGLRGSIDVLVPRGGKSLVARVQSEARVPVFAHLEGVCHVYVDRAADLEMARKIVVNAKMRRTGVSGPAETLLVDRTVAATI